MKVLFSAFTGYNFRELLLPLSGLLDHDPDIRQVVVITPAAAWHSQLFPDFGPKYEFLPEPTDSAAYTRLLASHRPDIVVTPTAGLEVKDIPLLQAAKQSGIPTLTFVASWDNVYKMERVMQIRKYRSRYVLADHFAVWNEMNRDHLQRLIRGQSAASITITGPPRFDTLASPHDLPDRRELLARLNLPDDGKKLIHVATTELYPSDYIIRALAHARGRALPADFHLLVSVHPGGNLAGHERYAAPYGAHVFYSFGRLERAPHPSFRYAPTRADLRLHAALFAHSDLLINHSSTVTIESLVADSPVVTVTYGRRFDWWRWYRSMVYRDFKQHAKVVIESGATRVATNERQLIAAAAQYVHNRSQDHQARQALTAKMVGVTPGTASQTMLDLIKKIATVKPSL